MILFLGGAHLEGRRKTRQLAFPDDRGGGPVLKKAPKQARSEQMVDCILEGATRVLNTMPLAQATTNRIAEVAGVSIGSLYQYFDSKHEIALALLHRHLDQTVALLRDARIISRGSRAESRLRLPIVEILNEHRGDRTLHLNLIRLAEAETPSGSMQGRVDTMIDEIALVLGEERPEADVDEVRLSARLRHHNAMLLIHAAVINPDLYRDDVVLDHYDALSVANLKALSGRTARGPAHA